MVIFGKMCVLKVFAHFDGPVVRFEEFVLVKVVSELIWNRLV